MGIVELKAGRERGGRGRLEIKSFLSYLRKGMRRVEKEKKVG